MATTRSAYGIMTVLLAASGVLTAQTDVGVSAAIQVTPPTLGHFFDRGTAHLQPVIGIAGNSFPGVRLVEGSGAAVFEVAPSQDSALVVLPDSGVVGWLPLDGSTQTPMPVPGAIGGVGRIAFSPSGVMAILYSPSSRQAQAVAGLPAAPTVAGSFDLSAMQGDVSAIGIDDGGDIVLAALSSNVTALYALTASSAPAQVYQALQIASISFLRNSHDAILSAPAENRVVWLRDAAGAANAVVVADGSAGVSAPLAAIPSQDGSRAFAVNREGTIWSIPLSGAMATRASCACQPTQLQRMRGMDVFLLTSSLDQPLAILDAGSQSLRIDLVPVDRAKSPITVESTARRTKQ